GGNSCPPTSGQECPAPLDLRDRLAGVDIFLFPVGHAVFVNQHTRLAPGDGLLVHLRQPAAVLADHLGEAGVAGQVGPFVGVLAHVVELFGAVGVDDIPPVFAADAVVVVVVSGDRRTV